MGAILIIEDHIPTAKLIANILRSLEHPILLASDAASGLSLAQEHELSLILLDMRLPGMDGWELVSIIRNELNLSYVPIVAVSVQINIDDAKRALQVGCDEYITKPFDVNDLRDCVAQYLNSNDN